MNKVFQRKVATTFEGFLRYGNNIGQSSVVVRCDLLKKIGLYSTNVNLIAVEDAHLWCRILKSGERLGYIKSPLGSYHYSDQALSLKANQFRSNRSLRLACFQNIKPGWYKYNIATYLIRKKMFNRARKYFKSIVFSKTATIELRVKALILMVVTWAR